MIPPHVSIAALSHQALSTAPDRAREDFDFGGLCVRVESNRAEILDSLTGYFRYFTGPATPVDVPSLPHVTVVALEAEPSKLAAAFEEWPREPGKARLKETFADVADGRVVHKVRTGMQFLLGDSTKIAVGPCLANMNQVVNFIVAQNIEHYLRRGWLLCHAAGVAHGDRALVIAAAAGGGKSTLALHLMRHGMAYVSNDRVLVRGASDGARAAGVPKLPRINPGTALHHPNLRQILDPVRREELSRLPAAELWTLEEKYDVHLDRVFRDVRFVQEADLHAVVLLGWRLQHDAPAELRRVDLGARPDLVAALAKSAGPMLVVEPGTPARPNEVSLAPYLDHLRDVPVYEITGGVDFDAATDACLGLLASSELTSRQPNREG